MLLDVIISQSGSFSRLFDHEGRVLTNPTSGIIDGLPESRLPLVPWEDVQESIFFEGERDASPDTASLALRAGGHNFLLCMNYLV